jgi:hypothetical protein
VHGRLGHRPGGQLDHERPPVKRGVLPVGRRSRQPGQGREPHPCDPRVGRAGGTARAPRPDQAHVLVKPHGDRRVGPANQAGGGSGLGLGERSRPRVLDTPGPAAQPPAGGEVAVQVDPAAVQPAGPGAAVGVEATDQQQPRVRRQRPPPQTADDGHPGALVAVDTADHHHRPLGRVAAIDGDDRPSFGGMADHGRRPGQRRGQREQQVKHALDTAGRPGRVRDGSPIGVYALAMTCASQQRFTGPRDSRGPSLRV